MYLDLFENNRYVLIYFLFFVNNPRYAFADILESERLYVADLQRIIEIYLYELTRQECPWFVKEKKDLLFSNIEDIFAFHKVYVIIIFFQIYKIKFFYFFFF
jgi:hypothetical protein